jgi:NAD(P)-dependent dehydrogenase (short-subunit alcohol dehydrogenase family)
MAPDRVGLGFTGGDLVIEIAWAILFLLSPLASDISGALLVVDGGWTVTQ